MEVQPIRTTELAVRTNVPRKQRGGNLLNHLLNGLSAVGNVLDLPGSSVRDLLAGQNPLDQWASPLHSENRTSGRDLLRAHGLAGEQNTWGNFAGGLGAEILTDPTNLISGKVLLNATRARRATMSTNAGIRSSNANSLLQRANGFMPEEIARQTAIKTSEGIPQRMYHGTNAVFDNYSPLKDSGENLYGKGYYHTNSPKIASEYTGKEGAYALEKDAAQRLRDAAETVNLEDRMGPYTRSKLLDHAKYVERSADPNPGLIRGTLEGGKFPEHVIDSIAPVAPANVRMQYLDMRNPFNMESRYPLSDLKTPKGAAKLGGYFPDAMESVRDEIRDKLSYLREARQSTGLGTSTPLDAHALERRIAELYPQRNTPSVLGQDYFDYLSDASEGANTSRMLQKMGFDGITHYGGKVTGGAPHNVAIAFDPSQVYKPYIAKAYANELPIPSARPDIAAGLGAYQTLLQSRSRK